MLDTRVKNDLVHVAVEGGSWKINQFIDTLQIIKDLVIMFSERFLDFRVKVRQDSRATCVQPESRPRGGMTLHKTLRYSRRRTGVV